jgi:hypothetical protein
MTVSKGLLIRIANPGIVVLIQDLCLLSMILHCFNLISLKYYFSTFCWHCQYGANYASKPTAYGRKGELVIKGWPAISWTMGSGQYRYNTPSK